MSTVPVAGRSHLRRVARTSLIGTAIEWYDFNIYGTTAALVFAPQFFPELSSVAATLAAFATFGVGFVARPLGGIVMGHFGDRWGRKAMLITSLLTMGIGTFAVGVLPNYASIGIAAPVVLVILRLAQGFGVGGEWGGAVLIAVEHGPRARRTFYGSFAQMGNPIGIALSALAFLVLTTALTPEEFTAWGWRIPFLLSAVLVVYGLIIRLRIMESPEFRSLRETDSVRRMPLVDLVRSHPRNLILGGLTSVASPALGYIMFAYLVSYASTKLGIPASRVLWLTITACLVWIPLLVVTAKLADRIGRKPVFVFGLVLTAVWMVPFFLLVNSRSVPLMLLAYLISAVAIAAVTGAQAGLIADLFPAGIRYSGSSVAYQLSACVGGGLAPIVATILLVRTGSSIPIALYLAALAVVGIIALAALPSQPAGRERAVGDTTVGDRDSTLGARADQVDTAAKDMEGLT